jgi:hypothetical protein
MLGSGKSGNEGSDGLRFLVPVVFGFAFLGGFGVELIRRVFNGKLHFG